MPNEWLTALLAIGLCALAYRKLNTWLLLVAWVAGTVSLIGLGQLLFTQMNGVVLELGIAITASVLSIIAMHIWTLYRQPGNPH